jgi:tetratricopeptide (TPR) repeat protein
VRTGGPGTPYWLVGVRYQRIGLLAGAGRFDELAAVCDQALTDDAIRAGIDADTIVAWNHRARLRAGAGDFEAAILDVEPLLAQMLALGGSGAVVWAAQLAAAIHADAGHAAEAVARGELALRYAERAEQPTGGLRLELARYLLGAGDAALALENAETVFLDRQAAGAPALERAEAAQSVGRTALAAGEPGLAYRALGEAVELAEAEEPAVAADAGIDLGRLLMGYQDEESVGVLERAVHNARRGDWPGLLANGVHLLGRARCANGDPAGLDDLDEATKMGLAGQADWFVADVHDSRGRALVELGDLDAGVVALREAADMLVAAEDVNHGAFAPVAAAGALAEAGRLDESITCYRDGLRRLREAAGDHPAIGEVTLALADVLDRAGQSHEAASLRESGSV